MTPHEQALAKAGDALAEDVGCFKVECWACRQTALAAIRAYLRARREIDGAMMCWVPGRLQRGELNGGWGDSRRVEGYNACRADVLASAEAHDADV